MQMWLSPDPILRNYLKEKANGGVLEPKNLGLYTYAWNNPVVMHDPDGRRDPFISLMTHGIEAATGKKSEGSSGLTDEDRRRAEAGHALELPPS